MRAENLLRNRLHHWIFFERKATTTHKCLWTLCFQPIHLMVQVSKCCVSGQDFSVAYGNVLRPTILHLLLDYHSPPSLWSASRWHSCLASFIAALRWMRRPHLHNSGGAGVAGAKGKPQELTNSGHPPEVRHILLHFKGAAAHCLKCVLEE